MGDNILQSYLCRLINKNKGYETLIEKSNNHNYQRYKVFIDNGDTSIKYEYINKQIYISFQGIVLASEKCKKMSEDDTTDLIARLIYLVFSRSHNHKSSKQFEDNISILIEAVKPTNLIYCIILHFFLASVCKYSDHLFLYKYKGIEGGIRYIEQSYERVKYDGKYETRYKYKIISGRTVKKSADFIALRKMAIEYIDEDEFIDTELYDIVSYRNEFTSAI